MNKRYEEFSAELEKIMKLVPGLDCTQIYSDLHMPLNFVCYIANACPEKFYIDRTEGIGVLAGRILECSKELLVRTQKNIDMLEEIVNGS